MAKISVTLEQDQWQLINEAIVEVLDNTKGKNYEDLVHATNNLERQYNIGVRVIEQNKTS